MQFLAIKKTEKSNKKQNKTKIKQQKPTELYKNNTLLYPPDLASSYISLIPKLKIHLISKIWGRGEH